MRKVNWLLLTGFLLSVLAFISYFAVFARFAVTRDVPWASFVLFAAAVALLVAGWRRSRRKVLAAIPAVLGVAIAGLFTYMMLFGTKNLPQSAGAPSVGQKAPEFTLADANGRPVSLAGLLSGSNGVLLVFYRGYW